MSFRYGGARKSKNDPLTGAAAPTTQRRGHVETTQKANEEADHAGCCFTQGEEAALTTDTVVDQACRFTPAGFSLAFAARREDPSVSSLAQLSLRRFSAGSQQQAKTSSPFLLEASLKVNWDCAHSHLPDRPCYHRTRHIV
jgi:hypothetical protein